MILLSSTIPHQHGSKGCQTGPTGSLPCWLDRGKVYIEWEWGFCPWGPASLWPCVVGFVGIGAGRWQNFPVALEGHQHWSLPMHLPPFRQGIWQKTFEREATWLTEARDSLYSLKIFGTSRSIVQNYGSSYTRIHVIRNRRRSTNRSGMCRVLCGQALFANSKGHVVVYSGTTGHLIPHDANKVSLKQRHSTAWTFETSFTGIFCCLPVTASAFGLLAFKINT